VTGSQSTSVSDRLDTIEQRLIALESATTPDRDGKMLGMALGIALLLFLVAAAVIGLMALWKLVA